MTIHSHKVVSVVCFPNDKLTYLGEVLWPAVGGTARSPNTKTASGCVVASFHGETFARTLEGTVCTYLGDVYRFLGRLDERGRELI